MVVWKHHFAGRLAGTHWKDGLGLAQRWGERGVAGKSEEDAAGFVS